MAERASTPDSPFPPNFLQTISHQPGVYLFKKKDGSVLYVGKARDLRNRLASYVLHKGGSHSKTGVMLKKAHRVETILTHTEKEALILEASLIKKHKPRYNIILRDDKNYPLIKVTVNEKWPRLIMTRRRKNDGSRYFGPYSSPAAMWETIRYLNRMFPLRRCKQKDLKKTERGCLHYQLKQCLAPCLGTADPDRYRENVKNVLLFLEGRNSQLIKELHEEMESSSKNLQYEKAAQYRDQIKALRRTIEKQIVVSSHKNDQDIFGLCRKGGAVALSVLFVRNGTVVGHQSYFFNNILDSDTEIIDEALARFYSQNRPVPDQIIIPVPLPEKETSQNLLSELKGAATVIKTPRGGIGKNLVQMAENNAGQVFVEKENKEKSWQSLAEAIARQLRLNMLPETIECLDISNIGGKQAVGSLVSFTAGEPEKKNYRHYGIRTKETPDDYAMMREVLERRFAGQKEASRLPDLLVVDGGKGQLNIARGVLEEYDLDEAVELAGIAKEKTDEGEKIFRPGRKNPITLSRHSPVLLFLMKIRDEAHRFGITSHRKKRNKTALQSILDNIEGIGPSRKKILLSHIGSVKDIKKAPLENLKSVPGIGPDLAKKIYRYFHPS